MRIPLIQADKPYPVTQQPNVGEAARARGAAANQALGLVETISRDQARLREKERLAQDTLLAIELDTTMKQKFADMEEGFLKRTDSENFDRDRKIQTQAIYDELNPKNPSNELKIAYERSFNANSSRSDNAISTWKYKVMEDRGRIAIGRSVDNAAAEYAATTNEATKKIIVKKAELEIRKAIEDNLVERVWGENQIRGLETLFKQKEVDAAEAIAIGRMSVDPAQLAIDLKDPNYLPGLTDKSRRATLANQAETAARIKKSNLETELEKAKKREFNATELQLSDLLYVDNDPIKAMEELSKSKVITDKTEWYNRIQKIAEGKKAEDPFKVSDEKYATQLFEDAGDGLVDPGEIYPIAGKLSRQDYNIAKSIATYAIKPDKKYIMDLTKSVLREGANLILGTDWLYFDKPDMLIRQRGDMERFVYRELVEAETDQAKLELLDETNKNFVLRRALQSVGVSYDEVKQEAEFAPLFRKSGGGTVKSEGGNVPYKSLWGEK